MQLCPRIKGNVKTKSVVIILRIVNLPFSQNAVYSKPMLFAKVKIPSLNMLNVERNHGPDHTALMPLWSNFILFCKDRFLCPGSGDITCVSAEQRQGKSYKFPSLRSRFGITRQSLVMPNRDPRDGNFCLYLTAMKDTYIPRFSPVLTNLILHTLIRPVG